MKNKTFSDYLNNINVYENEEQYRNDAVPSYSLLKNLYYSPNALLGEKKESMFMNIGSAVDNILTNDGNIPIVVIGSIPTGQLGTAIEMLASRYPFSSLEEIEDNAIEDIYDFIGSKSRHTTDTKRKDLLKYNEYFKAYQGKDNTIILTKEASESVGTVVGILRTHPVTQNIFHSFGANVNIFNQLKYKGEINNYLSRPFTIKTMFDILKVDEKELTISLKDLKIGSIDESKGFMSSFYMFKWYYQAVIYQEVLLNLYKKYVEEVKENKYTIEEFQFIYMNVNSNSPIIYTMDKHLHADIYIRGLKNDLDREIPSVLELFKAYEYYKIWKAKMNISDIAPYYLIKNNFNFKITKLI